MREYLITSEAVADAGLGTQTHPIQTTYAAENAAEAFAKFFADFGDLSADESGTALVITRMECIA